jgi:hypothetical protein
MPAIFINGNCDHSKRNQFILLVSITGILSVLNFIPAKSQSVSVYNMQNLSFGAMYQGSSGGNVTIAPNGSRTTTGTVILLNFGSPFYQAIFEMEAPVGTIVSISPAKKANLTGSSGGSMKLRIDNMAPSSPFVTSVPPPGRTRIFIGGTLTVGKTNQTPPGFYNGTFDISFNYE